MIDLLPDEEQTYMMGVASDASRAIAGRSCSHMSDEEWKRIGQVGVFGVGLAETAGGAGCGFAGEVLVAEAFGRNLAPVALLAPLLAAHVIAGLNLERVDELLTGSLRVALAFDPGAGQRWRVLDLPGAQLVTVVSAERLAIVQADDLTGVSQLESIDEGTELSESDGIEKSWAFSANSQLLDRARLLISALALGVSGRALERAVEYAKNRHQYGRPIGSFQAVKHRCVDMAIRHDAALSSVRFAAIRADAGLFDDMTEVAAIMSSKAARENAADAVQVFGGMGFTVEGGFHHLVRRSWLLERLLGSSSILAESLVSRARSHDA
jgi:alkylation response protein AidB-like acyl-CoA dehydrogenase